MRVHQRTIPVCSVLGFQHVNPVEEFPSEVWDNMVSVMLTAPFTLTKHLLPYMRSKSKYVFITHYYYESITVVLYLSQEKPSGLGGVGVRVLAFNR